MVLFSGASEFLFFSVNLSKFECNHDTRFVISDSGNAAIGLPFDGTFARCPCVSENCKDLFPWFCCELCADGTLGLITKRFAFDFKLKLSSTVLSNSSRPPNSDFCKRKKLSEIEVNPLLKFDVLNANLRDG